MSTPPPTPPPAQQPGTGLTLRPPANLVSPKARLLWTVAALLTALVLTAALVALSWFADIWAVPVWGWVMWALIALAYVFAMPTLRYRTHRWEATDSAVYTQTGWLGRERRIAPMSRVQTVDFEQGPIARAMGLAQVTVTTASAAGPLQINGLNLTDAEALVSSLTHTLESTRGDAT